MKSNLSACTSVLVGKDASLDGSTMIARNDDTFLPLTPQRFYVEPAYHCEERTWVSTQNGFRMNLPKDGYRYTLTPNVEEETKGFYAESGINEKNVAISATESVYGNPKALAYDPLVEDGLAEDSLPSVVLPYIDSARDGVKRLGDLIRRFGSPEGNGVLFSDQQEVWYMEIVTGHHWVAQRIPDDAYAVCANQVAIQTVDFSDPDNFMFSEGIQEFVEQHHLNPDLTGFNFRHIFGTNNAKDRFYNLPRVWFGQRYLTPSRKQEPTSGEMPFICHADRKISVEDVEYILSSHFNETPFDPFGNGSQEDKLRYRPISLNRTQNSHVLQIRNDVDENVAAIMWVCFGIPAFSPYVPFFTNANDIDATYAHTPLHMDNTSAYWMYRKLSVVVESHYAHFIQPTIDFKDDCNEMFRNYVERVTEHAKTLAANHVTGYLTYQNHFLTQKMAKRTNRFTNQLLETALTYSKLTYDMDKNL